MERIVYHGSLKGRNLNVKKVKLELWKNYPGKDNVSLHTLELDHIIPYSISVNDSITNLQLLTPREHLEKTLIDKKILRIFRKNGWSERYSAYAIIFTKSPEFLVKEYKKELIKNGVKE